MWKMAVGAQACLVASAVYYQVWWPGWVPEAGRLLCVWLHNWPFSRLWCLLVLGEEVEPE